MRRTLFLLVSLGLSCSACDVRPWMPPPAELVQAAAAGHASFRVVFYDRWGLYNLQDPFETTTIQSEAEALALLDEHPITHISGNPTQRLALPDIDYATETGILLNFPSSGLPSEGSILSVEDQPDRVVIHAVHCRATYRKGAGLLAAASRPAIYIAIQKTSKSVVIAPVIEADDVDCEKLPLVLPSAQPLKEIPKRIGTP